MGKYARGNSWADSDLGRFLFAEHLQFSYLHFRDFCYNED